MDELIAFVKARLDEDEQFAREANQAPWICEDNFVENRDGGMIARFELAANARHAAWNDPARVLREVEAKRAILAMYENELLPTKYAPDPEVQEMLDVRKDLLEDVVQTLADAWSDHADYRQEWAP